MENTIYKMPLKDRVLMLILTILAAILLATFGAHIHSVIKPIQVKEVAKNE